MAFDLQPILHTAPAVFAQMMTWEALAKRTSVVLNIRDLHTKRRSALVPECDDDM